MEIPSIYCRINVERGGDGQRTGQIASTVICNRHELCVGRDSITGPGRLHLLRVIWPCLGHSRAPANSSHLGVPAAALIIIHDGFAGGQQAEYCPEVRQSSASFCSVLAKHGWLNSGLAFLHL